MSPTSPDFPHFLNAVQKDALSELLNIGYGRAAAALAAMTGDRVTLRPPVVIVCPLPEVAALIAPNFRGEVVCVNQAFTGPLNGNAMLLLDTVEARTLCSRLGDYPPHPSFDQTSRDTIVELGNILLNACLGAFGNLLKIQVGFAVPGLHVESIPQLLHSVTAGGKGLSVAAIVKTQFSLRDGQINGYLMIILGMTSVERLAIALERLEF